MTTAELQDLVTALRAVGVTVFERAESGLRIRLELGPLPAAGAAPEAPAPEKLSERQRLENLAFPES